MRIFARAVLVLALLLAGAAIVVVLWSLGPTDAGGWATVAAALAVLTSVIGSWTAQRVLEVEEDKQKPLPHLRFDLESRYQLLLLRLTNSGGSAALDLSIAWAPPGLHIDSSLAHGDREAHFALTQPEVPLLLPGESVALAIANSSVFFSLPSRTYSGKLVYRTTAGRTVSSPFSLNAEHYRFALTSPTETLITHRKLQEIPKRLEDIADALAAQPNQS